MKTATFTTFVVAVFSSFFLFACAKKDNSVINQSGSQTTPSNFMNQDNQTTSATDNNQISDMVALNTPYGQIVIKLFTDKAPNTVKNFLTKVNAGFYNGLSFHRVEPGFVVQGGDPLGNGTGGGTIVSEITDTPFIRGSVGLARGGIKEQSNDSQFFICLSPDTCQPLTNEYVNFGQVVYGMEVVDQLQIGDKILSATTQTK